MAIEQSSYFRNPIFSALCHVFWSHFIGTGAQILLKGRLVVWIDCSIMNVYLSMYEHVNFGSLYPIHAILFTLSHFYNCFLKKGYLPSRQYPGTSEHKSAALQQNFRSMRPSNFWKCHSAISWLEKARGISYARAPRFHNTIVDPWIKAQVLATPFPLGESWAI